MDINVQINQIKNHFFSNLMNENEENEKLKETENYVSKICIYDFFSVNEINICEIIKQIPYYSNSFNILYNYDFIKVGHLKEKVFGNIENISMKNEQKYLLFQYKNIEYIKFNDFLFNLKTPKILIFNVVVSFSHLLQSLIKLNNNNVCFFNLSSQNIVFCNKYGEKPFLIDFQKSLQINKLNEKYISKIIEKTNDYTYKPLEVHVLFYLIHNDLDTISYSFIEEICEVYVNNLYILNLFSQKYREDFKISCINSLKKYINKPKNIIINDIIERNNTWDIYSLSLLYLHIIGNISRVFLLKDTFLSKLSIGLIKNINPDPLKRENLEKTLENYEKLFNDFNDWSFIKKIPTEKMDKLFKILKE